MAEGPTSIQQEADNIYQLLNSDQARNKERWDLRNTEAQKYALKSLMSGMGRNRNS
jgi:ATP-dependent exoDNAse (exonuclease V) alpha subunit